MEVAKRHGAGRNGYGTMSRPPSIPRDAPAHVHKKREGNSGAHLEAIRQLPCCVYSTPGPSDPHHLMRTDLGSRGIGMRAPDKWAIPLGRKAHDELHTGKLAVILGEEA